MNSTPSPAGGAVRRRPSLAFALAVGSVPVLLLAGLSIALVAGIAALAYITLRSIGHMEAQRRHSAREAELARDRVRLIVDTAEQAFVSIDADGPRDRVEPKGRGHLRLAARRGGGPHPARADHPRADARRSHARPRAVPRHRRGSRCEPSCGPERAAPRRPRVPGGAHDLSSPDRRRVDLQRVHPGHHRAAPCGGAHGGQRGSLPRPGGAVAGRHLRGGHRGGAHLGQPALARHGRSAGRRPRRRALPRPGAPRRPWADEQAVGELGRVGRARSRWNTGCSAPTARWSG